MRKLVQDFHIDVASGTMKRVPTSTQRLCSLLRSTDICF